MKLLPPPSKGIFDVYSICPKCGRGAQGYGFGESPKYCDGRGWWRRLFCRITTGIDHLHYKCWACGAKYNRACLDVRER